MVECIDNIFSFVCNIIGYREDQKTELKVELTKDIKKEIIAFANTNDGIIYIGIDDKVMLLV